MIKKFKSDEMLEQAIVELSELDSGQIFIVKDLFKGYIWGNQEIGTRRTLGTLFLNYANSDDSLVEALDKTSSNQQRYKKNSKQKDI